MKKVFQYYAIIWAILFLLFNVISFVVPGWEGQEKYTASFWIGYVFITLSFAGQLVCGYFAFKAEKLKKLFYNLSLVTTSFIGLILSFVFGGLCMLLSALPYWVGVIFCAALLAFNVVAVMKSSAAVDLVSAVDDKIKVQTLFVRSLTTDAECLLQRAQSDAVKAECKKVYESVRYSDPMSNDALASLESEITIKFAKFSDAVSVDNAESVFEMARELMLLIDERNKKCKLLK